jgi:hypothetical protein
LGARKIVNDHVKKTIKRTVNELKARVYKREKEEGKTKLSQKPPYWSEAFWRDLINYWETNEGHLHRAKVGSTNRQRVERLHSAGARSFNAVKNVITFKYLNMHKHIHTQDNFILLI